MPERAVGPYTCSGVPRLSRLVVLALLVACAPGNAGGWIELSSTSESAVPAMKFSGTVQHLQIEGGVWVIRSGETNFNPTNLPDALRTEGLRVDVEARRSDEMASISMVGPMITLIRIRAIDSVAQSALIGTKWELIELPGTELSGSARPTLEFADASGVSGFAGCNRFSGSATHDGDQINFGPLAATRMFCGGPAMTIETQFLSALQNAVRFALTGGELHLTIRERTGLVRFRAAAESAQ